MPRVLLIGDSIVMGYGETVEKNLAGKASVARLGTSRFVADPALRDEIALVLRYTSFDLIQFNNGLHGYENTDDSYAQAFPGVVDAIRAGAPRARLLLATSTPMRNAENLSEWHARMERIQWRNQWVFQFAKREGLPVNDLFAVVLSHPEYYTADGTHFNDLGNAALGARVADKLSEFLAK